MSRGFSCPYLLMLCNIPAGGEGESIRCEVYRDTAPAKETYVTVFFISLTCFNGKYCSAIYLQ